MFKDQILEFLGNYGLPAGLSELLASGLILISIVKNGQDTKYGILDLNKYFIIIGKQKIDPHKRVLL